MQAVLYVGHGTRLKKGVDEAVHFLQQTMQKIDIPIQEIAFLELVEPDIVEGVASCVAKGATTIAIVPILLLKAQHAKEDIPLEIDKAKQRFPNVRITVGEPFGIHDALLETVYERVVEQNVQIRQDAQLLLIGRGSSDPDVAVAMAEICEKLKVRYNFLNVRACFLYGNGPSFEQTLVELKNTDAQQIFMVPYLLFSGLLSVGIVKQVQASGFDEQKIILCNSLGYNEQVRSVLIERVQETLREAVNV
ncbi:MAG: sirohydrochlorin chelatase [Lysinibacillus sp.]